MGKTIRIIKLISFIIIAVEVLLGAVFSIIYFNNFFNFYNQVKPEYIAITMAVIIAVDCLFVWVIILVLSSLRQKTDLKAATIIGSDVQEAYNFAMIGLAITDDQNVVLWTNDLFKSRHIEIMDMDIIEWQPELATLRDIANGDQVAKIVVNSRTYQVKLLQEAGLWIFKDITDYESIYNYSKDQAPLKTTSLPTLKNMAFFLEELKMIVILCYATMKRSPKCLKINSLLSIRSVVNLSVVKSH